MRLVDRQNNSLTYHKACIYYPERRGMGKRQLLSTVLIGVLLLIAGCVSSPIAPGATDTSSPTVTPSSEPTPDTATPTPVSTETCPSSLSFWDPHGDQGEGWSSDLIRVTHSSYQPGKQVFIAAYAGNALLGVGEGRAAVHDWTPEIELQESLDGNHTIQAVAYVDTNENMAFDRGTDRPCQYNGERVQAGPTEFNFSSFDKTESA